MEKQREQATVNEIIEMISDIILQRINKNNKDVKEYDNNSTSDSNTSEPKG